VEKYYRLEDSNRAIALYEQILKEKPTLEVKTNLLAAYIAGDQIGKAEQFINSNKVFWVFSFFFFFFFLLTLSSFLVQLSLKENFEFAYNAGCVALEAGDLETAESYLTLAESTHSSLFY
jgi:tetratricopeptide (TPR) repeat protein